MRKFAGTEVVSEWNHGGFNALASFFVVGPNGKRVGSGPVQTGTICKGVQYTIS